MQLLKEDKRKREIKGKEEINFSSFSSFHLIVIKARARGEKQLSKNATDDEDLTVKIDDEKTFPKLSGGGLIDSPAAFSGGTLHNFAKTVYFLTFLKGREHKIELIADEPPGTATFESAQVYAVSPEEKLSLETKNQAEDGDRRPWITFTLDGLALKEFTPTISYSRHKRDSDDVKIIVDGKVQGNLLRNIKHFLWRYVGSRIPVFSSKIEMESFSVELKQGLHYIEFWADRMPTLQSLILNFGEKLQLKDVPTVDNPKWTGVFYDDTPEILLARTVYGEAGGESKEVKIAVGWAIRNRVEDAQKRWKNTYHEVILKPFQYEPFNDPNKDVFEKITNPPLQNPIENQAWHESFQVAGDVIFGRITDPTKGANHFYAEIPGRERPSWAEEDKFTIKIRNTRFYKL